jgi:hypothetical protein
MQNDRGRGVAGAPRFLAAAVDQRAVRGLVALHEVRLAAELARDRSDLDLDLAEEVVALMTDQLRARHQRDHLLHIGQDLQARSIGTLTVNSLAIFMESPHPVASWAR